MHVFQSTAYSQMQAADPMKRQADYIPLSNDSNKLHNITSSSTMNDETGVLFLDPDNLPQLRSIKDGFAAEIWSDAIFSPTDATLWLSQTIQSLQEDVFLGWYQVGLTFIIQLFDFIILTCTLFCMSNIASYLCIEHGSYKSTDLQICLSS